ncbi:uncharacterized protein J8A68_000480 [[Candida] subhashii]|uniref:Uncharacterized protein n=1 Tax=[Candida] subhashii TaxID=561895 RepID=A0A8J5V1Z6_9ASCO|nr:uncharacterized protein J8A68_000480 [[Candida] subhashii]KAG7666050.1 hypothetical protein J8A68_000480 [[Candida] subhashii]
MSVPRFVGDTDDEHSIHLNSQVGKAMPLPREPSLNYTRSPNQRMRNSYNSSPTPPPTREQNMSRIEEEMLDTLAAETDSEYEGVDYEKGFQTYILEGHSFDETDESDYDYEPRASPYEDEDYRYEYHYEDDDNDDYYQRDLQKLPNGIHRTGSETRDTSTSSLFDQIGNMRRQTRSSTSRQRDFSPTPPSSDEYLKGDSYYENEGEVESPSPLPENRVSKSFNWINFLKLIFASFILCLLVYVLFYGEKFTTPDSVIWGGRSVSQYEKRITQLEIENQQNKEGINSLANDVNFIKDRLSDTPVSSVNHQVQITPEFHQFLYKFIEHYKGNDENIEEKMSNFMNTKLSSLNITRLEEVSSEIQKIKSGNYTEQLINNIISSLRPQSESHKQELLEFTNSVLSKSLDHLQEEMQLRLSNMLADLTILNNTVYTTPKANDIWVRSMLDLISQGSRKVNYADASLGARILGYFRTLPHPLKALWWYMFPHDGVYNANHVIIDDESVWEPNTAIKELGIYLSQSIIPTDLLVEFEEISTGHHSSGTILEIGLKPAKTSDFAKLRNFQGFDLSKTRDGKYLSSFKLLKKVKIKPGLVHVSLPMGFINLQVTGRHMYFNFKTNPESATLRVRNVKVYGITELDAVKHADRFKLLVDRFNEAEDYRDDAVVNDGKYTGKIDHVEHYDLNNDIYL